MMLKQQRHGVDQAEPAQLNRDQTKMLATLSANMAQVSMASIVIPYFLDTFNVLLATLGLAGALFFSAASLYLLK